MLNKGHRNGLSGCRLGCRLGRGFGTTFGSFGSKLGSRLGKGRQPLWQAVCPRNITHEKNFPLKKTFRLYLDYTVLPLPLQKKEGRRSLLRMRGHRPHSRIVHGCRVYVHWVFACGLWHCAHDVHQFTRYDQ